MAENVLFGCDVATWAREGLIDALIPYSAAPLAMPTDEDTWSAPEQLTPFVEATRGTACTLAPNVMPRHMSAEDFRRKAHLIYGTGAEHLFFWDCAGPGGRANSQPMWNALRRLGSPRGDRRVGGGRRAGAGRLDGAAARPRRLGHDGHRAGIVGETTGMT